MINVMIFLIALGMMGEESDYQDYSPLDFSVEVGVTRTKDKPKLEPGWENRFNPPGGSMRLENYSTLVNLDFRFECTPVVLKRDRVVVGIPISFKPAGLVFLNPAEYGISSFGRPVGVTTLQWWDSVIAGDMTVTYYTPRIGAEVFFNNKYNASFSLQYYRSKNNRYQGDDCYGCVNSSHVYSSETIGSGISPRIDFFFVKKGYKRIISGYGRNDRREYDQTNRVGFYLEMINRRTWVGGVSFGTAGWLDFGGWEHSLF